MLHITSRDNERVKFARHLARSAAFRAQQGLFFAEGRRLCADLAQTLKAACVFYTEVAAQSWPEVAQLAPEAYCVSAPVAQKLAGVQTHQGVFCLFATPAGSLASLAAQKGVLLCENLQDPANVGAVLRSAAAFGFGGAVLQQCADPYGEKALRASMGAVGRLPVVTSAPLAEAAVWLRQQKVPLVAAALQHSQPLQSAGVTGPVGLLIGNEGNGLSPEALALANVRVCIPLQSGVESLNAAVAASVLMFAFSVSE